jgi:hypothetical protein
LLFRASCKKEKAKEGEPNGTSKPLMPFEKAQNLLGGQKQRGRVDEDQAMHLQNWIMRPTLAN